MRMRGVFLFFFTALCCVSAFSQVTMDKSKVKVTVQPGQTLSGTLTLRNNSNQTVTLNAYPEDFIYVPPYDASKKFLPRGSVANSSSEWLRYSPQKITLSPFESQVVNYTITVPPDVRGGYYSVLFFENAPEAAIDAKGLRIITRMGCLFFVETYDKTKSAELTGLIPYDTGIEGEFHNTGDVTLICEAIFYIMSEEGVVADRGKLAPFYLPKGEVFPLSIPLSDDLAPGNYTIVLTFDLEDGDAMVREVDFTKGLGNAVSINEIRE